MKSRKVEEEQHCTMGVVSEPQTRQQLRDIQKACFVPHMDVIILINSEMCKRI